MELITIVGGGPAGLKTAIGLKEEGWECSVIEEHEEIGKPVNCGGLISRNGAKELKLDLNGVIVNEIKGARIFSPNKTMLEISRNETVAFVIDREKFDKKLYKEAVCKGVEVRKETSLIDVRSKTLFVQHQQRGETIKTDFLIGADGASSRVRRVLGIAVHPNSFVKTYQVKARGRFEKEFVEMHFGNFAQGFFAWVIPESSTTARIGLGVQERLNPKESLSKFLEERNVQVLEESSSIIPVGKPLKEPFKEKTFLVGDAAFQRKASTGGGIITGINAANALSKTISRHLKHKKPLSDYSKELSGLNKELETHYKIHSYLNSLGEKDINSLFEKLKKAKIEKFLSEHGDMDKPSRFIGKILSTPSLWSLASLALKFR